MSKIPIETQIAAVERAFMYASGNKHFGECSEAMEAALKSLRWCKRYAPYIKTILEEFPGSTVNPREDD